MIFTTSWDDGCVLDMRMASLLEHYGCTGTFYLCPQPQSSCPMLTHKQIHFLSQKHEIGAHTITHKRLTQMDYETVISQMCSSKNWVESITNQPCAMFCYPFGNVDAVICRAAKHAGFLGARTVDLFHFSYMDPFLLPTSMHVYCFPWRRVYKTWTHLFDPLCPLRTWRQAYRRWDIPLHAQRSWQALAQYMFVFALEHNMPFFHLWGHSEEVDRLGLWGDLEQFLGFVSKYPVEHQANSQIIVRVPPVGYENSVAQ